MAIRFTATSLYSLGAYISLRPYAIRQISADIHFRLVCILYIHTNKNINIHTNKLTYTHKNEHTYIQRYLHIYIHAYIHTYINTYIHIYIYIHTNIHTYVYAYFKLYLVTIHLLLFAPVPNKISLFLLLNDFQMKR